ncbi:MAG TPA: hypothetical protein DCY93_00480 [Firmicutes bacterium]|nr:hypothetical protein [Bacillota bacterium]
MYENFFINVLCEVELIGTKVNALITRTTPRDVYDVYNLFKLKKDYDVNLIKKIAMFYITIGSDDRPIDFNNCIIKAINKIKKINFKTLKQTLIPVLKKSEKIVAEEIADNVIEIITAIFKLTKEERDYIDNFNKGIYEPNLLFKEYKINDISTHPMAIWKMNCILN